LHRRYDERMSKVIVNYDGNRFGGEPPIAPRVVEVIGEPSQPFHFALAEALGHTDDRNYAVRIRGVEGIHVGFLCRVDRVVTLGRVASFAEGHTLHVDSVGRGGSYIEWFGDVIDTALDVSGLVALLMGARGGYSAVRYREQRAAAKRWRIAGRDTAPTMELVQMVKSERYWELADIERVFALSDELGAVLLRSVGYEQYSTKPPGWRDPVE